MNDLVKKLRDYGTARETITLDDNGLQKAIRMIEDRDAACLKAADEIERLRKAINDYLAGDYERPVGKRWREDLEPCRHDYCVHKRFMWEDCEGCIDLHFDNIMKLDNSQPEQQDTKSETAAHIGDD